MTYEEAIQKINSLLRFGIKPGLERIREILNRLSNPQDKLRFIHIAGTNGKGTSCALISSTLTACGYKTGLYTSPYIMNFRERFCIDGVMISKDEAASLTERVAAAADQMQNEGYEITEFEFITALAFLWFCEQKCDVVVLEVGLGGRFDATNVIKNPLVSLIMSISLDHTAVLGDTVEKIAFEKCGIIKDNRPVVLYGEQPSGVYEVVKKAADEHNSALTVADSSLISLVSTSIKGSVFKYNASGAFGIGGEIEIFLPFIGEHQLKNAAAALTALSILYEQGFDITAEGIKTGFMAAKFFARLELLREHPTVLLDGAHNPGGARALSDAIDKYLGDKRKILIIGMLADKDIETAVSYIAPHFSKAYVLEPDSPRAMPSNELASVVRKYCSDVTPLRDYEEAYSLALGDAGESGAVVICGSLYLAGKMRRIVCEPSDENL